MNNEYQNKVDIADVLASTDPIYQNMLQENKLLEEKFKYMVKHLPEKDQAIAWDFVMHCEDMSIRKLELVCKLISK